MARKPMMTEYQLIKNILNYANNNNESIMRPNIITNSDFNKTNYEQRISFVRGFNIALINIHSNNIDKCHHHTSMAYQLPNSDWFVFDCSQRK